MKFFRLKKNRFFLGILGPPYCGIGATICIGQEMLCLPYVEFFKKIFKKVCSKVLITLCKYIMSSVGFLLNITKGT